MPDKIMQSKLNLSKEENLDKYYLGFSNILLNNPLLKAKLFEFFDYDIKRTFEVDKNDLNNFSEIYDNISIPKNFLAQLNSLDLDNIYNEVINSKVKYLTFDDENYPENLKNLEDFPLVLYYSGSIENINFNRTIGVVGSRNATESAKQNVYSLVSNFKNTDIVIVSGLASGIDSIAHKASIENDIKTIAVIGSGLDFKYPAQNKDLYKKIENGSGVIFSEFPNSIRPIPVNFPQRNRIVTGLSKGVIIAEAKMKSGAMISARYALEQGRELMCIPGLITNPNCEGIYHLIKNGAGIVTNSEDVLNLLGWEIQTVKKEKPILNGIEKLIYEKISSEEISIEGLKQNLDVGINELMISLTQMELSGLIIQKNGLYYTSGN